MTSSPLPPLSVMPLLPAARVPRVIVSFPMAPSILTPAITEALVVVMLSLPWPPKMLEEVKVPAVSSRVSSPRLPLMRLPPFVPAMVIASLPCPPWTVEDVRRAPVPVVNIWSLPRLPAMKDETRVPPATPVNWKVSMPCPPRRLTLVAVPVAAVKLTPMKSSAPSARRSVAPGLTRVIRSTPSVPV